MPGKDESINMFLHLIKTGCLDSVKVFHHETKGRYAKSESCCGTAVLHKKKDILLFLFLNGYVYDIWDLLFYAFGGLDYEMVKFLYYTCLDPKDDKQLKKFEGDKQRKKFEELVECYIYKLIRNDETDMVKWLHELMPESTSYVDVEGAIECAYEHFVFGVLIWYLNKDHCKISDITEGRNVPKHFLSNFKQDES